MSELTEASDRLFDLLRTEKLVMTAAESCTGGLISKIMTDRSGSSELFWGGFVTYSNEAKMKLLDVGGDILEQYGAVSEETVLAMAAGALKISGADCSVAVSGIAGPGGGSETKPVGTVWIAAALKDRQGTARLFTFSGDRDTVRHSAALEGLKMLSALISEIRY